MLSIPFTSAMRKRLGKKLKQLRIEYEFEQADVAKKVKFSTGYISQIELGKRDPSQEVWTELARLYDMTLTKLLLSTYPVTHDDYHMMVIKACAMYEVLAKYGYDKTIHG